MVSSACGEGSNGGMKQRFVLLLLIAALSCKNEQAVPADVAPETSATAATAITGTVGRVAQSSPPPPPPPGTSLPQAPAMPRMIIRTADVQLIVADAAAAVDKITAAATAAGGYVADSKRWRDQEQLRATLTLRVPAAKLDAALASIRATATRVQSETIGSDDVSQEYVDLESQVRNLEAAETEMRALMTTIRERAKKAEDILEVYAKLTELRGQIEQAKGRMRYLGQMSAMSTIKVELVPDAIAKPVVAPGWQPVAIMKNASRALVITLQTLATCVIWIAIYIVPIAAILLLVVLLLRRLISRRRGGDAGTVK